MLKLLIIQETISDYNIPLYEELNKEYDITVLHSDSKCASKQYTFKTIFVPWRKMYKLRLHKQNLIKIAANYDVVVCTMSLSYIYFWLMAYLPRKYKLIYWGIGVAASYDDRYDSKQKIAKLFKLWIEKSDAVVFYCEYPKEKYTNLGVNPEKLFVANNTCSVNDIVLNNDRNRFLFVGSLYAQKKVDVLIEQYYKAYVQNCDLPELYIVGDGSEYGSLKQLIQRKSLNSKIHLLGEIKDEEVLKDLFKASLLCFSPDQAGLSVLKAMGYGNVFVTHRDAITGGERFNVQDKITGILLNDFEEISEIMLDSVKNKDKYIQIGQTAYDFYWNKRTIPDMAKGFKSAISFVLGR